jgi:hypothetical protein
LWPEFRTLDFCRNPLRTANNISKRNIMTPTQPTPEQKFVDTNRISVRTIPMRLAKPIILQNHYIHKWSSSKISFGVFETPEDSDTDGRSQILIGVAVYGHPVGRHVVQGISSLLKGNEVLELKRLWIQDGHGKNIESFVIGRTFRLLKIEMPEVKVLVSYADPAAGHVGTIYQATNWLYQSLRNDAHETTFSLTLERNPKPEDWKHSRSFSRNFRTHNIQRLKQSIGRTFWIKPDSTKYRYLNFICSSRERRRIIKSLKHPLTPFKKEAIYDGEIQEIVVTHSDFYGN